MTYVRRVEELSREVTNLKTELSAEATKRAEEIERWAKQARLAIKEYVNFLCLVHLTYEYLLFTLCVEKTKFYNLEKNNTIK